MGTMNNEWDDGRTVADMSDIESPFRRKGRNADAEPNGSKLAEPEQMSSEDRRMYIFGAMGAAALIGCIFLLAAFIVILLMFIFW